MSEVFSLGDLPFELNRWAALAEFSWHTSQDLSKIAGSGNLSFSVVSLDPGKYSYPYHFHRNAEELFVIFSGKAILRKFNNEFVEIGEHDVLFFGAGKEGAHQLYNNTDKPCIYLDLRTIKGIDICEYPDTGKIMTLPYLEAYQSDNKVGYLEGENKVSEKWPENIIGHK